MINNLYGCILATQGRRGEAEAGGDATTSTQSTTPIYTQYITYADNDAILFHNIM